MSNNRLDEASPIGIPKQKFPNAPTSSIPIFLLSDDLISNIFLLVIDTTPMHLWDSRGIEPAQSNNRQMDYDRSGPLFLSAICRRWRRIAFSTPLLWKQLRIRFKRQLYDGTECTLLQEWLERSGSVPLTLSLTDTLYIQSDDERDAVSVHRRLGFMRNLVDIILSSIGRYQILHMPKGWSWNWTIGTFAYKSIAQQLLEKGMPSLRVLWYSGQQQAFDFRNCPLLETVLIPRWHDGLRFGEDSLHLRRIETTGTVNDLLFVLSSFPSLVECTFDIPYDFHDLMHHVLETQDRLAINLPHLETLCVKYSNSSSQNSQRLGWNRFSMPSLKTFAIQIRHEYETDEVTWPMLYQCLQKSRPPLESLTLDILCLIPDIDFIGLLSWMPKLRCLTIKQRSLDNGFNDRFWRALRGDIALYTDLRGHVRVWSEVNAHNQQRPLVGASICPRLEILHVDAPSRHQLEEVASTIVSRFSLPPGCTSTHAASDTVVNALRHIRLSHCDFDLQEILQYPGIDQCVQAGLDILVTRWIPGRPPFPRIPRDRDNFRVARMALDPLDHLDGVYILFPEN